MADLTKRTMRGVSWTSLGRVLDMVARLVVLGVLARQIPQPEHGLMAGVLAVLIVAQVVAEWGLGQAVIQRKTLTDSDIRVAFGLSLTTAMMTFTAVFFLAPSLEDLLDLDGLSRVLRVAALVMPIRALSLGEFLAQRGLRFKRWAMVELASYVLGYGVVAVAMAYANAGVWAFVGGQIGQVAFRTVAFWFLERHPMVPVINLEAASELLNFGSGQALGRLFNVAATQAPLLIVSRGLGGNPLAEYQKAARLVDMPSTLVGQVTSQVMFPAMAEVQDDPDRLERGFLLSIRGILLLAFPMAVLGAILAREVVDVLLGDTWSNVATPMSIFVFSIVFQSGSKLLDALTRATGHVYRRAARQALFLVATIIGALIGQTWGLAGVAWGVLFAHGLIFVLMSHLALGVTGVSRGRYLESIAPPLTLGLLLVGACWPAAEFARLGENKIAQFESRALPELVVIAVTALAALIILTLVCRTGGAGPTRPLSEAVVDLLGFLPSKIRQPATRVLLGTSPS